MKKKWPLSATIILVVLLLVIVGLTALLVRPSRTRNRSDELLFSTTTAPPPKQLWTCGMHPQVIQDHPGLCPICHMTLTPLNSGDAGATAGTKKVAYWWDPMLGPTSISNHPGKSGMGMDMVPVYENQLQAGAGVQIDPAVVQNMGVLTAPVRRGPLALTVRAVGVLEVPEPAITDVTLRVGGYIDKLDADTNGMVVAKGQVLFELYSPQVQVAEQELIGAEQALRSLGDSAPSAQQDVQRLVTSARRKLQLWGIADADIDAVAAADQPPHTVPFRSPADGHIEDKSVVEGSAVQAGQKLMRIENHTTLWLNAQVYEDQIEAIKVGQVVNAAVDGLPGETFTGVVSFIYPHLDHMTRTEIVRTELPNPEHALRPGMYATVEIRTNPLPDAILIPREAVIDTGAKQMVFVADPEVPGHFEPRAVRVGLSGDDDRIQIVQGLAPGEQVVTSGQFLMDVESRTVEAIEKLRGTGGSAPKPGNSGNLTASAPAEATGGMGMPAPAPGPESAAMPTTPATGNATVSAEPTTAPANLLRVAHCPMKNADWLQTGDDISNPFFGTRMPSCGSVVRTVTSPPVGTPLGAIVEAYLSVAAGLDADRVDGDAVAKLVQAAVAVPGNDAVRTATQRLGAAGNLDASRAAFANVGSVLIPLLTVH